MASILNTGISELVNHWGERVAFNEGYQKQKIAEATQAGRDAFQLGLDRGQGRDLYFEMQANKREDVQAFLSSDSAAGGVDVDYSSVVDQFGNEDEINDAAFQEEVEAIETLGMESVVADESLDVDYWADVSGLNDYESQL